jgi:AraC-like DNA-binding protein
MLQGILPENKGIQGEMRTLDAYAFVYVYQGTGTYMDENGFKSRIGPGSLILLFPGLAHRYTADSSWAELFFILRGPVLEGLQASGVIDPGKPVLNLPPPIDWRKKLEAAQKRPARTTPASSARHFYQVIHLLTEMVESAQAAPEARKDTLWLEETCERIRASLTAKPSMGELAVQSGMASAETFRKRFTRLQGCTPGQYRYQVQIEQACRILRKEETGFDELATRLGFHDAFHFSKRFKAATGMSPSQFRNAYRG